MCFLYSGIPPAVFAAANVVQDHYRWRNDDGSETAATWKRDEDTPHSGLQQGENIRLRLGISNTGIANSGAYQYQLEYAESTSGPWSAVPAWSGTPAEDFQMTLTNGYIPNESTTDQVTGAGGWVDGNCIEDPSNITPDISLGGNSHTNVEYCFEATNNAKKNATYYFRITDAGTPLQDPEDYDKYPELILSDLTLTAEKTTTDTGNLSVSPGETDQWMGTFGLVISKGSAVLSDVFITLEGTGAVADVATIRLYEDSDPDYHNGGAVLFGSATPTPGKTQVSGTMQVGIVKRYLHVVFDIANAPPATINNTTGAGIAVAIDLECEEGITATGTPQSLGTATLSNTQNVVQTHYRWRNDDGDEGGWWYDPAWGFRKIITVNASQVPADQTYFPVMINIEDDTDFQSGVAQSNGGDILFTKADGMTKLPHEIEEYNSSDGDLVAWVNVAALSSANDTILYMYYGNASCPDQWQPSGTWEDSFYMVQHLQESPANGIYGHLDSTWRSNHGAPTGFNGTAQSTVDPASDISAWDSVKIMGGADRFDGIDDAVTIPHNGSLDNDDIVTVEAWIRSDVAQNNAKMNYYFSKAGTYMMIFDYNGGQYTGSAGVYSSGGWNATPTVAISANQWHYAVMTFDGEYIRFYLDGTEAGNYYMGGTVTMDTNTEPVRFGLRDPGNGRYFDGGIDEVRISHAVRTPQWIQTVYNNISAPGTFYTVGAQDTQSGATWIEAEDTPASETKGTKLRLRIQTANSGALPANGYQYLLQYSTSTSGPWTTVPATATTEAFEMDTTGNYVNHGATSPQLTVSGIWTAGETIEDPDNDSNSHTCAAGEYSEFEYCITITDNAANGTTYFFRVTDSGAQLDTYSEYAELRVGPKVGFEAATSVGTEGGADIIVTCRLEPAETSSVDISVPYTLSGTAVVNTDYEIVGSNPLTISAGQLSADITVRTSTKDDSDYEIPETVIITMGTPVNAGQGVITEHTVTISDNDYGMAVGPGPGPDTLYGEGNQGDTVYYSYTVTNTAGSPDLGDLTAAAWGTGVFYLDNTPYGFDSGDTLLTDTGGSGAVDTGTLASGESIYILAQVNIPGGASDGDFNDAVITVASGAVPAQTSDVTSNTWVINPLFVSIALFEAEQKQDGVLLRWVSGFEMDNIGFNVLRRQADGTYIKVNSSLIPSKYSAFAGVSYEFFDREALPGSVHWYMLEDVDTRGQSAFHGPVCTEGGTGGMVYRQDSVSRNEHVLADAGQFEVIKETDSSMTVRVCFRNLRVSDVHIEGKRFLGLSMPSCGYPEQPGVPRIPYAGTLLDVPSGSVCTVISKEALAIRDIMPEPNPPSLSEGSAAEGARLFEPAYYEQGNTFPSGTVKLVSIGRSGNRDLTALRCASAQTEDGVTEIYRSLTIRIEFPLPGREHAVPAVFPPVRPGNVPPFDSAYDTLLISTAGRERNIYAVTADEFVAAGISIGAFPADRIAVYDSSGEIPIKVTDGGNNSLEGSEYIAFMAEPYKDPYTDRNVYRLGILQTGTGKRVSAVSLPPAGSDLTGNGFARTYRIEKDILYVSTVPSDAGADHWYWHSLYSAGTVDFPVDLGGVFAGAVDGAGRTGTVTVYVAGNSSSQDVDPDHHVTVSINGILLGDMWFDGKTIYSKQFNFSQTILAGDGTDVLQFNVPQDSGAVPDAVLLDRIEVEAEAAFTAQCGRLECKVLPTGQYTISGFSSDDIYCADITGDPVEIIDAVVGGGSISFSTAQARTVFAVERFALGSVSSITAVPGQDLRAMGPCDYVIIADPDFAASASQLSALHPDLDTVIVNVTDVYNQFGTGRTAPEAIKAFLEYRYAQCTPSLKYALLLGDAARDRTGMVPARYTYGEFSGVVPADNWYACVSGNDAVPDIALGRLPAGNPQEVLDYAAKADTYLNSAFKGPWEETSLFIADDADGIPADSRFEQDNIDIASRLPGYFRNTGLNLSAYFQADDLTRDIVNGVNQGNLITEYLGHGGVFNWATERVFAHSDVLVQWNVDELFNINGQYPFFVTLTCLDGYFTEPHKEYRSLSERLVFNPSGGAIAVFSASGFAGIEDKVPMGDAVFAAVFTDDVRVLGDAVRRAKERFAAVNSGNADLVMDTHNLMGDPALELRVPSPYRPYGLKAEYASEKAYLPEWAEQGEGAVLLTWQSDGENIEVFEVYRSSQGSTYVCTGTVGGSEYSFADTEVTGGTSYRYRIVSVNERGLSSPPSDSVSVKVRKTDESSSGCAWSDRGENKGGGVALLILLAIAGFLFYRKGDK